MSTFAACWYLSGLLGSALLWLNMACDFDHPPYCPTPRAIIVSALGAVFGPIILVSAGAVWLIDLLIKDPEIENWLTRPICRRKRGAR